MTYPVNFRKKILKIKEKEQLSYSEVAKRFMLSKTTVFSWSKKLDPQQGRNRKPSKIDMDELKKDIEKYPDSYCHERAKRLGVSPTAIRDAQYRLGVTYKKTLNHPKENPEKRSMFCQEIQKLEKEGRTVYINESGFSRDMTRKHVTP